MPAPKSMMNKRAASSGFTLIELMVVLTLIGFLSGLVLLRPPHGAARDVEITAQQLQTYIYSLSEWSLDSGEIISVQVDAETLRATEMTAAAGGKKSSASKESQRQGAFAEQLKQQRVQGKSRIRLVQAAGQRGFDSINSSSVSHTGGGREGDIVLFPNGELSTFALLVDAPDEAVDAITLVSDGLNLRLLYVAN